METPQPSRARRTVRFVVERLKGGAFAELATIVGDTAMQDTVEFEPVQFPHGLRLCEPPEHGWEAPPPEAA